MSERSGPLAGLKIIELAGIGPGPFCAMLLADLGATVIRIDRPEPAELGIKRPLRYDLLRRGRETLALDLKSPAGRDLILELAEQADALIEGFRPGVVERLGLGPDDLLARNPAIAYGRITGWGQDGPLAKVAGHDINYIAITGMLAMVGAADRPPPPPLNLVGDYAGGGLYLAFGLVSAILCARATGKGQVVDAAIVDGVSSLMTTFHGMLGAGMLEPSRSANILDGGAYYYGCYACSDGRFVSVGPIEPKFHALLLDGLGIDEREFPAQAERERWEEARSIMATVFRTKTRDDWAAIFSDTDACVAPVLDLSEAHLHPQLAARASFVDIEGVRQPAPAPRFSETPPSVPHLPREADSDAALGDWLSSERIAELRAANIII